MQSNGAVAVPVLSTATVADVATLATFGAFKVEDRISFVRQYDPRVQMIPGFRHSVARYRNTDGKGTAEKPAKMVTVPQLRLPEEYDLLSQKEKQVILGMYEDEQDKMIRVQIDNGASYVGWDSLSLAAVLESMTAVRISARLTKEAIDAWFRVAAKDACSTRAVQIAQSKNFNQEETQKQIAGTLNAYCEIACKLAAPVPNIGREQAIALKNLLTVANLDDDMTKVIKAKLDAILNPKILEASSDL